jgi:putative membrane protein
MSTKTKTLILCVDQDNDIGNKTTVATPIIGEDQNKSAAADLAVSDPEEAYANAMFGAVKLYNEMRSKYPSEEFQVATIAGSPNGGVEADRNMLEELKTILSVFPADGVVLVTDGFSDDTLHPIIMSHIPITSIHHVVVKHSARIEETYVVLGKYLRMAIEDPYYSRITLGVPGILLIIFGFLTAINQLENAGIAVTFVLGVVFLLKGFGIYDKIIEIRPMLPPPEEQLNFVSKMVGAVVIIVGIYLGASAAYPLIPPGANLLELSWWAINLPPLLGVFILKGIDGIIFGVMLTFVGSVVSHYLRNDERVGQGIVSLLMAFWMRFIAIESAKILLEPNTPLSFTHPLIFYTLASVSTTIIAVFLTYRRYKRLPFT